MKSSYAVKAENFFSVSEKELEKFFNKLEKKCLDIHKACENDKVLSEIYSDGRYIKVRATFTFHPYHKDNRWLLYKVEYSLPGGDFDTMKDYSFQNHYKTWYSYYNNNLKGQPACNFNYFYVTPIITINAECKVDKTKVVKQEGNLFEGPKYTDGKICYFNHIDIRLELNNLRLINRYLKEFTPVSDKYLTMASKTNYTGEQYDFEEVYEVLTRIDQWKELEIEKQLRQLLKNHIELRVYNK